jgi:hypothetical protein
MVIDPGVLAPLAPLGAREDELESSGWGWVPWRLH